MASITDTKNRSKEKFDDLLLEKENFWIGTLCTIHKGLEGIKSLTSMTGKTVRKLD